MEINKTTQNETLQRILEKTTGNLELRRMVWNANGKNGEGAYGPPTRLFSRNLGEMEQFINNGSGDVFHGVQTRKPGAKTGTKNDIYEIVCWHVDVDFKIASREEFEEALKNFPHQPTIIIDSGNGRHLYWFLKAPILLNGDAKQVDMIEAINRGLGKHFSGDHTHNIDRVLRTPGRPNSKWPSHPLCQIISADGPEYDLDELEVYADGKKSSQGARIHLDDVPDELPARFKGLLTKNRRIQKTWNGERPDIEDQSGSGYDMAMAVALARHKFTPQEVASVLLHMPAGKGKDATPEYLEHTISKAFASSATNGSDSSQSQSSGPERVADSKEISKQQSQAEEMVKLADKMTLFHDEFHEAYSVIEVNGHSEVLRCRSKNFRRYLAYHFYNQRQKPPGNEALNSALGIIEAKAVFDGEQHTLHNRVAWHDGAIWYDLSDQSCRAIRLTGQGWEIVNKPPILFRRYNHQDSQVEPVQGGSLNLLDKYVNITESALKLFKVSLCAYLVPDIPHPIQHAHGEHGAGKSFFNRVARALVDPSHLQALSLPRDQTELAQLLSHHYFAPFDNVSVIQSWISDALCRAVTGEGFTKRELYSDDEDVIYKFRRCIGLNGINIAATATDLMDRLILIEMNRIGAENRREEKELWAQFENDRAKILGAVFDALVKAIRIKGGLVLGNLPRMADFALWGEAISRALGNKPYEFTKLYEDNIKGKNEEVVHSNPVAAAIVEFMEERNSWTGLATPLLTELERVAEKLKLDTNDKTWPKAPHILTRRIKEILSSLPDVGILVRFDHPEKRHIEIRKVASKAPEAPSTYDSRGLNGDAIADAVSQYRQSSVDGNGVEKQDVGATDATGATLANLSEDKNDLLEDGWEEIEL